MQCVCIGDISYQLSAVGRFFSKKRIRLHSESVPHSDCTQSGCGCEEHSGITFNQRDTQAIAAHLDVSTRRSVARSSIALTLHLLLNLHDVHRLLMAVLDICSQVVRYSCILLFGFVRLKEFCIERFKQFNFIEIN